MEEEVKATICYQYVCFSFFINFSCYKVYDSRDKDVSRTFECDFCDNIVYSSEASESEYIPFLKEKLVEGIDDAEVVDVNEALDCINFPMLIQEYHNALERRNDIYTKDLESRRRLPDMRNALTVIEENDKTVKELSLIDDMSEDEANSKLKEIEIFLHNGVATQAEMFRTLELKRKIEMKFKHVAESSLDNKLV